MASFQLRCSWGFGPCIWPGQLFSIQLGLQARPIHTEAPKCNMFFQIFLSTLHTWHKLRVARPSHRIRNSEILARSIDLEWYDMDRQIQQRGTQNMVNKSDKLVCTMTPQRRGHKGDPRELGMAFFLLYFTPRRSFRKCCRPCLWWLRKVAVCASACQGESECSCSMFQGRNCINQMIA